MRTVVSNSEVPHLWAHQSQPSARTSNGNLFFAHGAIYSYGHHFMIAQHVINARAESAVLFTTENYSVTTQHHKSLVRRAIPRDVQVFHVPLPRNGRALGTLPHREDVLQFYRDSYQDRIDKLEATCARARVNREYLQGDLLELIREANNMLTFFDMLGHFEEPVNIEEIKARAKTLNARKAERERQAQEQLQREYALVIAQWQQGESVNIPYAVGKTFLRIENDEVVTSLGARFPVEHARKGLMFVRAVKASGREYKRNGHTFHLGVYPLDHIDTEGNVHAGCHYVTYDEIERIAPALETTTTANEYQPKTGAECSCKSGVQRDNCSSCEGTGWVIDFAKIRAQR